MGKEVIKVEKGVLGKGEREKEGDALVESRGCGKEELHEIVS